MYLKEIECCGDADMDTLAGCDFDDAFWESVHIKDH